MKIRLFVLASLSVSTGSFQSPRAVSQRRGRALGAEEEMPPILSDQTKAGIYTIPKQPVSGMRISPTPSQQPQQQWAGVVSNEAMAGFADAPYGGTARMDDSGDAPHQALPKAPTLAKTSGTTVGVSDQTRAGYGVSTNRGVSSIGLPGASDQAKAGIHRIAPERSSERLRLYEAPKGTRFTSDQAAAGYAHAGRAAAASSSDSLVQSHQSKFLDGRFALHGSRPVRSSTAAVPQTPAPPAEQAASPQATKDAPAAQDTEETSTAPIESQAATTTAPVQQ